VFNGGKPGDVLIYSPDKTMALKEAECLILWKNDTITLSAVEDKLAAQRLIA